MKQKLALLLAVLLCTGAFVPGPAPAASLVVEIGDRPYYDRGPWYWHNGVRWYWVPGHWAWRHHRRVWFHGHYVPRHHYSPYWRY